MRCRHRSRTAQFYTHQTGVPMVSNKGSRPPRDVFDVDWPLFGELSREGTGWKFKAVGTSSKGGLFEIARTFGVNVAPP